MLANYNDMAGLIDKLILIDEYTAKFNKNNIVIAVKFLNEDAANDCKKILEKHFFDIIRDMEVDSDISKNYTLLFIELDRNSRFADNILAIIHTLTALSGNKKWYFKITKDDTRERIELNHENLRKYIIYKHKAQQDIEKDISKEIRQECFDKKNNVLICEHSKYLVKNAKIDDILNEGIIETDLDNALEINECFKNSIMDKIYETENHICIDFSDSTLILERL